MSRKIGEVGLFRPRRAFRLEVPQRLPKLELCVVRQRCCNALLYILRYSKYIQIRYVSFASTFTLYSIYV